MRSGEGGTARLAGLEVSALKKRLMEISATNMKSKR
jgi:hypothetical protein